MNVTGSEARVLETLLTGWSSQWWQAWCSHKIKMLDLDMISEIPSYSEILWFNKPVCFSSIKTATITDSQGLEYQDKRRYHPLTNIPWNPGLVPLGTCLSLLVKDTWCATISFRKKNKTQHRLLRVFLNTNMNTWVLSSAVGTLEWCYSKPLLLFSH